MKNSSCFTIWTLFALLALPLCLQAQVSINETNDDPDPSAMLDVKSTNKGMLIPRMTTAERDAIAQPATGLQIYNTDISTINYYDGTAWKTLDSPWKAKGDSIYYDQGMVGIGTDIPTEKLTLARGNFLQTPGNPTHAGSIQDDITTSLQGARDIFVSGKYVYVAAFHDAAVEILDISDPTNPTRVGGIVDNLTTALDAPYSIHVSGKYAYIASDNAVEILDISDPTNPTHVGAIYDDATTALNGAVDIVVSGKYAYVPAYFDQGIEILDISDPTNPTHVGAIYDNATTALRGPASIYVSGKYAYVAAPDDDGVEILDISDPTNPTHVGAIYDDATTALKGPVDIYVSGKYAYVAAANDDGVEILDISDPANPTHVGAITDNGNTILKGAAGIHVSGKYAYVIADDEDGVQILDISDPTNPTPAGSITDDGTTVMRSIRDIHVSGKYAYVASSRPSESGLEVLDISGLDAPSASIGNIATNQIDVSENARLGSLLVKDDLNVGKDVFTQGQITASSFVGDGSRLTGIGDDLGDHTATQDLNLAGNDLSNGGTLTATAFVGDGSGLTGIGDDLGDHTATQELDLAGNDLSNGGTLTATAFVGDGSGLTGIGDNLGGHTATQNLQLSGFWLSHSGADAGLYIAPNGHIGLGTDATNAPLTVGGSAELNGDNTQFQFRSYGGVSNNFIQAGGIRTNFNAPNSISTFTASDYQMEFFLPTDNNANTTDVLTLRADGHVGIGTTSPDEELHLIGQFKYEDGNALDGYVLTSDATGVATWQPAQDGQTLLFDGTNLTISGGNSENLSSLRDNLGDHTATQNLQLDGNWLSHDGGDEGVFVDATGKVGIGTDSPGERFNVNGNIRLDGNSRRLIFRSSNVNGTNISEIRTNVSAPSSAASSDDPWDNFMQFQVARNNSGGKTDVLHLQGDGRVGLGTSDPEAILHLDFADQGDTSGIMLSAGSSNSVIYHQDSDLIIRKRAHTNTLVLDASGNVGIGTASPSKAKLEIVGSGSSYTVPGTSGYYGSGGFNNNSSYSGSFSLYANGIIGAAAYVAHSDMRIKQIEGLSNSEADLETLMQIEVTDYRLLDTLAQCNAPVKKVIAQQVAEVYPQAVTNNLTEVVPDIYQRAAVQDGWIMLATNLTVGERVKLISEQSNAVYEVIAVEANRFQVSASASQNASLAQTQSVFVFGREVNDFHTVDYEAISMLNVSATQEQQRIIEQQQAEIEMLKTRLQQQQTEKASFEARLQALEAMMTESK
ncbi:MAG: hypothetical protein AAF927_25445 [Bacteroidota bacterium]